MKTRPAAARRLRTIVTYAASLCATATILMAARPAPASEPGAGLEGQAVPAAQCQISGIGAPYIPVDSWVYPAIYRLYSLGYVDAVYLGMRPWTRTSIAHMLESVADRIDDGQGTPEGDQAQEIYVSLLHELRYDI